MNNQSTSNHSVTKVYVEQSYWEEGKGDSDVFFFLYVLYIL